MRIRDSAELHSLSYPNWMGAPSRTESLISKKRASKLLGVCPNTFYKLLRRAEAAGIQSPFKPVDFYKRCLATERDLEAFLIALDEAGISSASRSWRATNRRIEECRERMRASRLAYLSRQHATRHDVDEFLKLAKAA